MAEGLSEQLETQRRKVDYDSFDITVKELISMATDSLIDIAPEYQRQFRWDAERESTFIESVFLGIPVPSLYMAANADGTWELIDGVQRLSTLIHFVGDAVTRSIIDKENPLQLRGLEKLSAFVNLSFDEIPKPIQIQFLLKPLKIITISDKSDLDVRFDLFERLNTGGIILTAQEIRSCVYRGPFNEYLRTLAQMASFKKVVVLSDENERNGTREEFVLRFFAYLYKYSKFGHSVKEFLNRYMKEATSDFDYSACTTVFENVFEQLATALPEGIHRNQRTTPANLYEAIAVGAALAWQQSRAIVADSIDEWMSGEELAQWTTVGTNNATMVRRRIEYCRDKFLGK